MAASAMIMLCHDVPVILPKKTEKFQFFKKPVLGFLVLYIRYMTSPGFRWYFLHTVVPKSRWGHRSGIDP